MPSECAYSLQFFKIFRGACPRTPLGPLRAFGTRARAYGTRPLRARLYANVRLNLPPHSKKAMNRYERSQATQFL